MCVYVLGRFTFKILGQVLLLWFTNCFSTLKYCYLLLSLFTSLTIIFTIISIITVTIYYVYCNCLEIFTTLTTYVLTLYWFKIWFSFCYLFLSKLYVIIFCWFFKLRSVPFFFPHSFSVVTVNCDNRGRIQINESEPHSLPLPFNSDW